MTTLSRRHEQSTIRMDEDVVISGWTIEHYTRIAKWPSLVTLVLNIIVTTAQWDVALTWFFLIVLTIFLGASIARIYHGTIGNAAGVGLVSGLIVGVSTSLFQFLWYHSLVAFFQIVTTSLLSMLVGVLMSSSAYLVLSKDTRTPAPKQRHKT